MMMGYYQFKAEVLAESSKLNKTKQEVGETTRTDTYSGRRDEK